MDRPIPSHWRIDELECEGLRIIQDPSTFCFGMDAVLLAHFARAKSCHRVLDLGTGQGILPLLLFALFKPNQIIGIEIQQALVQMAHQSVLLNELSDRIHIECGDYRDPLLLSSLGQFQLVVANPPYHPLGSGELRRSESDCIARFELTSTLSDVVHAASAVLYEGGRFCMVHLPKRLSEIVFVMEQYKLTIKRMIFIHPHVDKPASLVLIEGIKNAKPGLIVQPPLYVHESNGSFTKTMQSIYEEGLLL